MTTGNSARRVLAEVAAIAAELGVASVTDFVGMVPTGDTTDIAIFAADGIDAGPLAAWIRELGTDKQDSDSTGPAVTMRTLEALATVPEPVLAPNRVLIALRCGYPLTADEVAAATSVMTRPPGTFLVVLTGAEDIQSAEDLTIVERGVWRTLLAPDGEPRDGQDIASHGCLLWTDQDAADAVRQRVTADNLALRDWLTRPVTTSAELDRARADCALTLAMEVLDPGDGRSGTSEAHAVASAVATEADDVTREDGIPPQLADLGTEVRRLHELLLSRLDADAGTVERQMLASLQTLEQDLATRSAGRSPDYAATRARQWAAETDRLIAQQSASARDDARHLLSRVDWDLMNEVVARSGTDLYPDIILDELWTGNAKLPAVIAQAVPSAASHGPDLIEALRSVNGGVLVTAGIGAAALGLLGLPLLPVTGAAALGVIGGSVYHARRRADEERRQALRPADTGTAGRPFANPATAVTLALRQYASAQRAAAAEQFTLLERALDERAHSARAIASPSPAESPVSAADQGYAADSGPSGAAGSGSGYETARTMLRALRGQLVRAGDAKNRSDE